MILNCFVCDRTLDSAFPEPLSLNTAENQPYGGTTFISYGQYGSTVFDPMDRSFLEMNICDKCLIDRKEKVLHVMKEDRTKYHYKPWNPEEV